MDIYQVALRPLLFNLIKADPENLHSKTINTLEWLGNNAHSQPSSSIKSRLQQSFCLQDSRLSQSLFGLQFPNPVGLAAGFDKDGVATPMWSSLGFGFAEIGTVTSLAQPGNPRPRLFRLPKDEAALNRMGFNNCGADAMAARLAKLTLKPNPLIPIGINLGKSKVTPLEEAANDYRHSFNLLKNYGDYFVVNVSSPNTPGLRKLQDAAMLSSILDALQQENNLQKPIFVKISPDLEWEAITEIVSLAQSYKLAGIIATNTTIKREGLNTKILAQTGKSLSEEAGGISGKPVRKTSTEVIKYIWQQSQGEIPIIGVGGIFTAEDAWDKITAGACLVQIYTGWVYQGPGIIRSILQGLLLKLEQNGLNSISEAVGLAVKDS
ncbi:dihydroorotate oxidase A [Rivularia sp. PCC 7116]|uniref:quinone-dependent dihydroorotate dehydrogenase n=1 Tax=Rivularia sp. PCC 7116 TaxID=373994 RepID=UPI00029EC60E|nr:quinone-dependent dihydroorotate dehydrogenase [Rivularia sp. PCC 7116]AFY53134.1 dihydroorotate oxidase A [Rivularia sp. PCC 7116]